jgi:UPF0755 protein
MKRLIMATALLALVGVLVVQQLQQRWEAPLAIPAGGLELVVESGDSLRAIAAELHAAGVVDNPLLLRAYGRWTGLDQQIKRGEYRLPGPLTAEQLLHALVDGNVISYQVTLPEGITLQQALAMLSKAEALESEVRGIADERLRALAGERPSAEGLFLPETYHYERGDSDWDILQRAHAALNRVLAEAWQQRMDNLPYESPYEALIMASIIERETGVPEERREIAGVFVRRLQRRMRLQTDPTIIYGLGESFDGNLRRVHLNDPNNIYNTYRHHGLPPTPIALPGRAAIEAALNPADGDSLFFVARGDGSHTFSSNLADHERAVRQYQLQRRADYRSSPGGDQ